MNRTIGSLLLFLLIESCAVPLPYSTKAPLTGEMYRSLDGAFSGNVPQGWFSSTTDTPVPGYVASFIKEDYSAGIMVKELHLDRSSAELVRKRGLELSR